MGACPVNKLIDVEDIGVPNQGPGNSQQADGPGPVSACQAARLASNGGGGSGGARGRRYRWDSTHRDYCTGVLNFVLSFLRKKNNDFPFIFLRFKK